MAAKAPAAGAASGDASTVGDQSESAELAEGFVQTAAPVEPPPREPSDTPQPAPRQAAATTRNPAAHSQAPPQRQQALAGGARRAQDDGVPVWIDRAIVGLIILLSALVVKVLFGV